MSAIGIRSAGAVGVLDEVRVPRRDLRAADPVALEAARLEHPPGAQLVVGVLEHAAERALVGRLRGLAQGLELGHGGLDLVQRLRREPELGARDDLAVVELRVPVGEPELGRRQPVRPVAVHHERPLEDRGPVAPVGARVHPDAPADRARNRARELEPTELCVPRPVEADRVGRASARDEELAVGSRQSRARRQAAARGRRSPRRRRAGSSRARPSRPAALAPAPTPAPARARPASRAWRTQLPARRCRPW